MADTPDRAKGPDQRPAPSPGIIPLRPLGLGDLYGGAAASIRRNPESTLLPALPACFTLGVARFVLQDSLVVPNPPFFVVFGVIGLLDVALSALVAAVLIVVQREALIGRRTSLGQAWQEGRRRLPGLLAICALVGAVLAVAGVGGTAAMIGLDMALRGSVEGLVGVLIGLAVMAVFLHLFVTVSLSAPAHVIEGVGVGAALRRSARLVHGRRWRILGVLVLVALVLGAASVALGIVVTAVWTLILGAVGPTTQSIAQIFSTVMGIGLGTAITPFVSGLLTLLYVDQRIRRERFDLQLAVLAAQPPAPR